MGERRTGDTSMSWATRERNYPVRVDWTAVLRNGESAKEKPCGTCNGKGTVTQWQSIGDALLPFDYICSACAGSGKMRQ